MDQFLKECPGCIGIANDITVHGHTEAEHDAHLHNIMQVACKYGVMFNPQKMHVKAQAINFFGCLYNANGVHLDPEKVDVVHALPAPTNVTVLQEFLSMVTYLCPFIHLPSMDLVFVVHYHVHPQSFVELNCYIPYSQKGGCCMIVSYCLVLRTDPSISWHMLSGSLTAKDNVDMLQYSINSCVPSCKPE